MADTSGMSIAEEMALRARQRNVSDLANRAAIGDDSAVQEARAQDGSSIIAGARDILAPLGAGISSGIGSLAHLGSSALNVAGLSNNTDKSSFASGLDTAGDYANKLAHTIEGQSSIRKQVEDAANQTRVENIAGSGDQLGAAWQAAKYKASHPLETASEIAGAIAVPAAIGAATGGLGAAAGLSGSGVAAAAMAGRVLGFGGSTAGNTTNDVYNKYMSARPETLKALNPEFAANSTPEHQERIARAAATKAGMIDFGINSVLTEFGPLGRLVRGSSAEAAAGVVRAGLGNATYGGITEAAKRAASNSSLTYGMAALKGAGRDATIFGAQAGLNQVNQNDASMGVDPNAQLSDGVAAAIGASLPAGIALGARGGMAGARAKRAEAVSAVDQANQHADAVTRIQAEQGLSTADAITKYIDADPYFSQLTEANKIDAHEGLAGLVTPEGVSAKRDAARSSILEQAKQDVIDGKAIDMKTAITERQNADNGALHESLYKEAIDRSKDDVHVKAIEAGKAKTEEQQLNNGKVVADDYVKTKGVSDLTFEDYVAQSDGTVSEKAVSDYNKFQARKESLIDGAKTRVMEAMDKIPSVKSKDPVAAERLAERRVNQAIKESGVAKSKDFKPEELRSAIDKELGKRKVASDEQAIHEAARKEMLAEVELNNKSAIQKGKETGKKLMVEQAKKEADRRIEENTAYHETRLQEAAKTATPKGFEELARAAKKFLPAERVDEFRKQFQDRVAGVKEAEQGKAKSAMQEAFEARARDHEAKLEEAVKTASMEGFNELRRSAKGYLSPERIDSFRKQIKERDRVAKEEAVNTKLAEKQREEARKGVAKIAMEDATKTKVEKQIEQLRGTVHFEGLLSKIDRMHLDMQEQFAKSGDHKHNPTTFQYDSRKASPTLKRAMEKYLHEVFPGSSPESLAGRHAMHKVMGAHWKELNGGKTSGESRRAVNEKLRSEGKEEVQFRLDDSSQPVNGNIHAGMKITPEEVVRVLQALTKAPLKELAKFIKISKNVEEAFAHEPERAKDVRVQADAQSVKGLYSPKEDVMHIFADDATSHHDVAQTIIHEINHRGLNVIMNSADRVEFSKLSQRLMNGNSYVRKMSAELVAKRRIPENATPEVKLAETMAYMAENMDALKTDMARSTFNKVVMALRQFVNQVIVKAFGQEAADKVVPHMSDRDVLNTINMVTAKGFSMIEGAKGERFTTFGKEGFAETNYLFRNGDPVVREMTERLQDSAHKFSEEAGYLMSPVAALAKMFSNAAVTLTHERSHGEVRPIGEPLRSARTKADQDRTGELAKGLRITESQSRLATSISNRAMKIAGPLNMVSAVDGSGWGVVKEFARTADWMTDRFTGKAADFIGKNLRELDPDGSHKYFEPAEIQKILEAKGAAAGIKPSEFQAVKEKYKAQVEGHRAAREDVAKAVVIDAMQVLKSAFGGKAGDEIAKIALDDKHLQSTSLSDLKGAFDRIVEVANTQGDFADLKRNKSDLKAFVEAISNEIRENEISGKSGYIAPLREGRHFVSVTEKFMENGEEKVRTLHRPHTDSQGEQIKRLRDIKDGLHLPEAEREAFKRAVEAGTIVIKDGTVAKGKERLDQHSTIAALLDSIDKNKEMTAEEREAATKAVTKAALSQFTKELNEEHSMERNSRRMITGYESNSDRASLKAINSMSAKAARIATRQKLTNFLVEVSHGEHRDNAKLREDARKLVESFESPDKQLVNNIKGITYLAYLGGSPASALLQHFQQYVLAAPVLGQYMEGGNYAKVQGAIAKASWDIGRGYESLKDPAERQMIKDAIEASYIQHPELVNVAAHVSNELGERIKPLGALGRAAGTMMATVEFNNRAATFLAAHRLYKDKIGADGSFGLTLKAGDRYRGQFLKEGDPAIGKPVFANFLDFASHVTSEAHFDPNKYNKADIERGAIGALMMQFKMFPIHMLQTAMRLPMRQRAEMLGTLALLSGTAGLPFASNIEDLIDAGSEWMGHPIQSKKLRTEAINAALGETGGLVANKGVSGLVGLDFGTRVGVGDIIPFLSALRPSNQNKTDDIAKSFGASFSYANSLVNALGSAGKGNYREAFQKAAPTAIGNIVKGVEILATGEQRNPAGELIRKDVNPLEGVARALGFNSATAAAYSEVKEFTRQDAEQHSFITQLYTKAMARAQFNGDQSGVEEAMTKIREWNMGHMGTALMIRPDAIRGAIKAFNEGHAGNLEEIDRKIKHASGAEKIYLINAKAAIQGLGVSK